MANLGAINNPYTAPIGQTPDGGVAPTALYSYLVGQGANPNEAHMLTGAAANESGLNPNQVHDGGIGYGLFGHNGSRLMAMKQFAQQTGQPLSDWKTQAGFALQELRSRPEAAAVANATTPEQLALGEMHYERPQGFTASDPTAGHNYTGRLNTIKSFTALNPNATGAFAASANPQVTPAQVAGAGYAGGPSEQVAAPASANAAGSSTPANLFGNVGNAQLDAGVSNLMKQLRQNPDGTYRKPLVQQAFNSIVSPVVSPLKASLAGILGGGGIQSALPSTFGGTTPLQGDSSAPQAAAPKLGAADATAQTIPQSVPSQPDPSAIDPNNIPVPPSKPASLGGAADPLQAVASLPTFAQPDFVSSLSGLFGAS